MTHLDVQGCTEKICNVWPEDVKDVDSILDICFNHDGMCWWDIFSMFIKHSNFCWACKLEVIMSTEAKKLKIDDTTSVTGYIHNVSVVKMSALKKNKYFNAVIQVSRDDFCDVAVFSVDKRSFFLQAQNCRSAVRLRAISKEPSKYFIKRSQMMYAFL